MSSVEDASELKAGHPPAVKAGGMRIARNRQSSTGEGKDGATEPGEEQISSTPPKQEKHQQKLLISGAVTSGDRDFKADAVKQYHDKPTVSKEKNHSSTPHNIHQPR